MFHSCFYVLWLWAEPSSSPPKCSHEAALLTWQSTTQAIWLWYHKHMLSCHLRLVRNVPSSAGAALAPQKVIKNEISRFREKCMVKSTERIWFSNIFNILVIFHLSIYQHSKSLVFSFSLHLLKKKKQTTKHKCLIKQRCVLWLVKHSY